LAPLWPRRGPDAALTRAFEEPASVHDEEPVMRIEHRDVLARRKAGSVVWFDFKERGGGSR
jgi:cell division protein ZapE